MQAVTITQITPPELEILIENSIKRVLNNQLSIPNNDPNSWFDLNDLCAYLPDKPAKPTVYGWIQSGSIPYHKGGKKLRFLKSEIDNWLLNGMKKPELVDVSTKLLKKRKRRNDS